ncbi:hypothetical protein DFJ73DRAFT_794732 [Zopfochytrium polystomum]|nr:hypothetical protein DFJ73DRAFT_794732 [Zopfochytrium polystomum]
MEFAVVSDPAEGRNVVQSSWFDVVPAAASRERSSATVGSSAGSSRAGASALRDSTRIKVVVVRLPVSEVWQCNVSVAHLRSEAEHQNESIDEFEDSVRAALEARMDKRGRRAGCSIRADPSDASERLSLFVFPDLDGDIEVRTLSACLNIHDLTRAQPQFEIMSLPLTHVARPSQREVVWSDFIDILVRDRGEQQKRIAELEKMQAILVRDLSDTQFAFDQWCREKESVELENMKKFRDVLNQKKRKIRELMAAGKESDEKIQNLQEALNAAQAGTGVKPEFDAFDESVTPVDSSIPTTPSLATQTHGPTTPRPSTARRDRQQRPAVASSSTFNPPSTPTPVRTRSSIPLDRTALVPSSSPPAPSPQRTPKGSDGAGAVAGDDGSKTPTRMGKRSRLAAMDLDLDDDDNDDDGPPKMLFASKGLRSASMLSVGPAGGRRAAVAPKLKQEQGDLVADSAHSPPRTGPSARSASTPASRQPSQLPRSDSAAAESLFRKLQ